MNIAHGKPRIVVGVDESPASLAALPENPKNSCGDTLGELENSR